MSISNTLKLGVLAAVISATSFGAAARDFLNVSYDPTRELYEDVNKNFGKYWESRTGQKSILSNRMAVQANRLAR